jgi:GntR family transcriptional regulator, transcriptional repressor for pyruvate dehydrogenase complex
VTAQEYRLTTPASNRRVPKISEIVASELRQKILRGEIPEGESLSPESVLVEEYNVSRPSLREALRLLEAEGLVAIRRGSHRGPVATRPDTAQMVNAFTMQLQLARATLADVYRFRMIFEPPAACMAAGNADEQGIAVLHELLAQEKAAMGSGGDFGAIAWRFHTEVVRLAGNITMTLVTETLEKISARHASAMLMGWEDQEEQRTRAYRAHRRLVGLIERHDGHAAQQFWAKHMAAAGKRLLEDSETLNIIELLD